MERMKYRNTERGPVPVEIERKFLVDTMPEKVDQYPYSVIIQGYVLTGKNGSLRLRKETTAEGKVKYLMTIKRGKGIKKEEIQTVLSQEQFEVMWPAVANFLEKVRFKIPFGKHTIDFDMYKGNRFNGLITAEVEFESVEEAEEFVPPEWFGEEKTDDSQYSNANLAKHGLPEED